MSASSALDFEVAAVNVGPEPSVSHGGSVRPSSVLTVLPPKSPYRPAPRSHTSLEIERRRDQHKRARLRRAKEGTTSSAPSSAPHPPPSSRPSTSASLMRDLRWSRDTMWSMPSTCSSPQPRSCTPLTRDMYTPDGLDDILMAEAANLTSSGRSMPLEVAEERERRKLDIDEALTRSHILTWLREEARFLLLQGRASRSSVRAITHRPYTQDQLEVGMATALDDSSARVVTSLFKDYLSLEAMYDRDDDSPLPPRERMARLWWAQRVANGADSEGDVPLEVILRKEVHTARLSLETQRLEDEESRKRSYIEEAASYIAMALVEHLEFNLRMQGSAAVGFTNMEHAEAARRQQILRNESEGWVLLSMWREVQGVLLLEEEARLLLKEGEEDEWLDLEGRELLSRPVTEKRSVAVGTDYPLCPKCNFSTETRFCGATGEPHARRDSCNVCGMDRYSNQFCPTAGMLHEHLYDGIVREKYQKVVPPVRSLWPTLPIKTHNFDLIHQALQYRSSFTPQQFMGYLREMVAPKLVLDMCLMFNNEHGLELDVCDEIFKQAMTTLKLTHLMDGHLPSSTTLTDPASLDEEASSVTETLSQRAKSTRSSAKLSSRKE
eukprot:Sspe_Gene.89441::Locus_61212_Transcript_1_1_Confidence_1.000_Length_1876::g.89441::m.89441